MHGDYFYITTKTAHEKQTLDEILTSRKTSDEVIFYFFSNIDFIENRSKPMKPIAIVRKAKEIYENLRKTKRIKIYENHSFENQSQFNES